MTRATDFMALGVTAAELLHDMRGLLALVDARMSLVLGEMRAGRSSQSELEAALAEHRDLSVMVADIVETVSGRQGPGDESVRPGELVRLEIERALRGAAAIEVRLNTTVPENAAVFGRVSFLRRTVGNLLRNALRHARSYVLVTLHPQVRQGRGGIRIAIEDDGAGVDPALRDTLFGTPGRGAHGGVSLGLTSVAWTVGQLGGEIAYRDGIELGGARFEVWLPSVRLAPARGTASPIHDERLAGRSVVVVDDDPSILRVFTRLLEHRGAHVLPLLPAAGFDSGWLAAIERANPDAILLDLDLGGETGVRLWEVLHRQLPELADRVVFVSGESGGDAGIAASQRTGRPVIGKPLDLDEVVSVLEQVSSGKA